MVGIRDIAKMAKVSTATVSRVLNNDPDFRVSEETRNKVLQIAKRYNYQVDKIKLFEGGLGNRLAIFTRSRADEKKSDLFYEKLKDNVIYFASTAGFHLDIHYLRETDFDSLRSDYLAVINLGNISQAGIDLLRRLSSNLIFVNSAPNDKLYDAVIPNLNQAMVDVVEHLISAGFQRIGFIGGETNQWNPDGQDIVIDNHRYLTFIKMMTRFKLYQEEDVYLGKFSVEEGYRLMMEAIDSHRPLPQAFIVASDELALGAVKALNEEGIAIPDQVALFSFNNSEIAKYSSVPLSSVDIPNKELARTAIDLVKSRQGGRTIPHKVIVPTSLVVRESSRPNKREGD